MLSRKQLCSEQEEILKEPSMKIDGSHERVEAELSLYAVAITPTSAAGRGLMVLQWAGHSSKRCECDMGLRLGSLS